MKEVVTRKVEFRQQSRFSSIGTNGLDQFVRFARSSYF